MSRMRTALITAVATVAAATLAGVVARVRRSFALPGSREPKIEPLDREHREWLDGIASQIDPAALRHMVESWPGPRNRFDALEAMLVAEDRLALEMADAGWSVERRGYVLEDTPLGGFIHEDRIPAHERLEGVNLLAVREGVDDHDALVLIAHYDTVEGTVGADDNTAAVASLLTLARLLPSWSFRHTVMLVATDMEESGLFGAYVLACQLVVERTIIGVICFDTVAYTSTEPDSQTLPAGVGLLFPEQSRRLRAHGSRGDSTVVIYDGPAVEVARALAEPLAHLGGTEAVVLFRDPADLPVVGRILRRAVPGVRNFSRSDHRAFWDAGLPAIWVSDTGEFRYPHYHEPTDTPEKLDYTRLKNITAATAAAVARTAGLVRECPRGR